MFDKKTLAVLIGVSVVVLGLVFWGLHEEKLPTDDPDAIVYYYGESCPYCKVIDEFLTEHNVAEKVSFEKKEVWSNKANASEMGRRARVCDIRSESLGVPFVYAAGKCFVGEPDVRRFFAEKANINLESSETQK